MSDNPIIGIDNDILVEINTYPDSVRKFDMTMELCMNAVQVRGRSLRYTPEELISATSLPTFLRVVIEEQ